MSEPRIVVVGGGVIGSAVAWTLARAGARVTLLERGEAPAGTRDASRAAPLLTDPSGRASTAAAGMLAPLKEAEEPGPFMDLGLASMARWPAFVTELEAASGLDIGFREDGRLDLALDDQAADALRRHRALQADAGYESRILDPDEIQELEPAVGDAPLLGLATDYDFQVDAARTTEALWTAAAGAGDARSGAEVQRVEHDGGRVTGVRLATGETIGADAVVVAAGAWTPTLELPTPLPVRPVRGQIVTLRTAGPVLRRTVWGPHLYLVPRADGRTLVGSTMEEAGYAAEVTAGAIRRLLDLAVRIVPRLADAEIESFQVGLRPAARDGLPILGPDPAVAGLIHATGHFRNGILLAPETAARVRDMILDDAAADPAFDPARFQ